MDLHLLSIDEALRMVASRRVGLGGTEAAERTSSANAWRKWGRSKRPWRLFLDQFRSPLVMLLIAAMGISLALGDHMDVLIVLSVVLMSTALGFWQEHRAANTLATLLGVIQAKARVLRDGNEVELPFDEVVAGDVILLSAGNTIPGDGLLIESLDLFVDESALTGESYPAEKKIGPVESAARQSERTNTVYEGTNVVSGTARALMITIGPETEFGSISERLKLRAPETDFERGLRRFGEMLIRMTLLLVIAIFATHVYFHRPVLEAFMFSLAIAVGMTPELLPAIVTITLARGAQTMAKEHTVVRRLSAIENFGCMTVFCSDKTGTLTEGHVNLQGAYNAEGEVSAEVLLRAILNAAFETGFANPIDEALRSQPNIDLTEYNKCDEIPYDFIRKRLSVVVQHGTTNRRHQMITKGAFANILAICTRVVTRAGEVPLTDMEDALQNRFAEYSNAGYRVLGLATRDVTDDPIINKDDEQGMTFEGFLLFDDPPKAGAIQAIEELRSLGIAFKVITGDNQIIAQRLGGQMGITHPNILTGDVLHHTSDDALVRQVGTIDIFAEIEPSQKERIIIALRKAGQVVGYLGDGINDASALHAADIGISVDSAVDVAKEAADIVLLRNDLQVLARGVRNGRITFANTLKYIFVTTSANFGNMFSMAGASLFLPFLPLLPKQILLNNFLADLPAFTIATDSVDPEQVKHPRRWDHHFIRHFMVAFGLVSSIFDYLTFGILLRVLHASERQFQTGWFIESVLTQILIILVIRTHRPLFRSRPSRILFSAALLVALIATIIPYTPPGLLFGLVPLPLYFLMTLIGVTLLYLSTSEAIKQMMFSRFMRDDGPTM